MSHPRRVKWVAMFRVRTQPIKLSGGKKYAKNNTLSLGVDGNSSEWSFRSISTVIVMYPAALLLYPFILYSQRTKKHVDSCRLLVPAQRTAQHLNGCRVLFRFKVHCDELVSVWRTKSVTHRTGDSMNQCLPIYLLCDASTLFDLIDRHSVGCK